MPQKKIRIVLKGSGKKVLFTEFLDDEEAQALLRDEVLPKIGKEGAIGLPGLVVNAREVASAQIYVPPTPARGVLGRAGR